MDMPPNSRAQENHDELFPGHVSTLAVTDPELIEIFDNFAFDDVLRHGNLDSRTRLMVQLAAMIASQAVREYRVMLGAALTVGVTPVEIKEIVYQAVPYVGMAKVRTGWFAAVAANVKPGMTVAVVGDGAVGLLGVLSAKQMGAERIIAMSRHEARQKLAREFGATDIVPERGDEAVSRIKDMTDGIGADAVLECVGTQESMMQAIRSTRPGGGVGYVGVPHDASLDLGALFWTHVRLHGGPAPVWQFLPDLIKLVWNKKINPGKVFDLTLPLDQVAEGYRAMDERRAIKALLRP
jgi:threonine dehydrogenase-like Zn-dependent dehydrogenase